MGSSRCCARLTVAGGPGRGPDAAAPEARMTENGTQIIEAPKFLAEMAQKRPRRPATRSAPHGAGGQPRQHAAALTELVAQEHNKTVVLECIGLELVPPRYQATIKNVAIQLIRNAVMHGVETLGRAQGCRQAAARHPAARVQDRAATRASSCSSRTTAADSIPTRSAPPPSRAGLITEEAAARLRDRQAIKLIFKSGYSTLTSAPGEAPHGTGMSLVRRYVHEAGGKIALATLLGHETRFKVTLPALAAADAQVA